MAHDRNWNQMRSSKYFNLAVISIIPFWFIYQVVVLTVTDNKEVYPIQDNQLNRLEITPDDVVTQTFISDFDMLQKVELRQDAKLATGSGEVSISIKGDQPQVAIVPLSQLKDVEIVSVAIPQSINKGVSIDLDISLTNASQDASISLYVQDNNFLTKRKASLSKNNDLLPYQLAFKPSYKGHTNIYISDSVSSIDRMGEIISAIFTARPVGVAVIFLSTIFVVLGGLFLYYASVGSNSKYVSKDLLLQVAIILIVLLGIL